MAFTRARWLQTTAVAGVGFHVAPLRLLAAQTTPDLAALADERIDGMQGLGVAIGTIDAGKIGVILRGESGGAQPLDRNTVFEIGSVTKTFTASLLAQMVRAGEVALDDPIGKFLPNGITGPTFAGKHITLLDLATQSSGLPRLPTNFKPANPNDPYADYTPSKLYEFLSSYALTREPGTKYEYSNLGVGLLGQLLANRAGASYPMLIANGILRPLRMEMTGAAISRAMFPHTAVGHDADGDPVADWHLDALAGAGALRSSLEDMLKYLAANMNGTGVLAQALRDAQQPRRSALPNERIALAWEVRDGSGIVWHNGQTGGYHAFIGFSADHTRGIVILSNGVPPLDDIGFHWLDPTLPLRRIYHAALPPNRGSAPKAGGRPRMAGLSRAQSGRRTIRPLRLGSDV